MPGSNPTASFFSSWLTLCAWPLHPPAVLPQLVTPLSHSKRAKLCEEERNLSLPLQRGVSWAAAFISHPWQGTASWRGREHPVTHPLQHSMLESCGWSSVTSYLAGWPRLCGQGDGLISGLGFCFPQPLHWVSVPPMKWEKFLSRGERQSPFPSTAMFLNLLKLPVEPSQPPILILGTQSSFPGKLEVAAPEDEDSLSNFCPYLWEGKTWVHLRYWKALCCLYIEYSHVKKLRKLGN